VFPCRTVRGFKRPRVLGGLAQHVHPRQHTRSAVGIARSATVAWFVLIRGEACYVPLLRPFPILLKFAQCALVAQTARARASHRAGHSLCGRARVRCRFQEPHPVPVFHPPSFPRSRCAQPSQPGKRGRSRVGANPLLLAITVIVTCEISQARGEERWSPQHS